MYIQPKREFHMIGDTRKASIIPGKAQASYSSV